MKQIQSKGKYGTDPNKLDNIFVFFIKLFSQILKSFLNFEIQQFIVFYIINLSMEICGTYKLLKSHFCLKIKFVQILLERFQGESPTKCIRDSDSTLLEEQEDFFGLFLCEQADKVFIKIDSSLRTNLNAKISLSTYVIHSVSIKQKETYLILLGYI